MSAIDANANSWSANRYDFSTLLLKEWNVPKGVIVILISVFFGLVNGIFDIGFDKDLNLYPDDIADGWGIWYFVAKHGVPRPVFYGAMACLFSLQVLDLLIAKQPARRAIITLICLEPYFTIFHLFGELRWGIASLFAVKAASQNTVRGFLFYAALACGFHKAAAAPCAIILLWMFLRDRKHAYVYAFLIGVMSLPVLMLFSDLVLTLLGYEMYAGEGNPQALAWVKVAVIVAVAVLAYKQDERHAKYIIIISLLFLPTMFVPIMAGRAFTFYFPFVIYLLGESRIRTVYRTPLYAMALIIAWMYAGYLRDLI